MLTEWRALEQRKERKAAREYMMFENIRRKADACLDRWNDKRKKLRTKRDLSAWQRRVRKTFLQSLGPFPEKTPLNPRILGRREYKDYALEKVVFESRPTFFVTSILYKPKKARYI